MTSQVSWLVILNTASRIMFSKACSHNLSIQKMHKKVHTPYRNRRSTPEPSCFVDDQIKYHVQNMHDIQECKDGDFPTPADSSKIDYHCNDAKQYHV